MDYIQVIIWAHQVEVGDAMLKMTKGELELIPDPDIYTFFEKGGISYVSNRYNKANDKYLKSSNPKQESKHIIYFQQVDSNG